jgi:hypothetical protein
MVKVICQSCNKEATLQQIGSSGNYYRCKHYLGMKDGKPQFSYHQVSKAYALTQLNIKGGSIVKESKKSIDLGVDQKITIDPIKPEYSFVLRKEGELVRSPGFEPGIISLEG